ncbi:MFS transporter [Helicobacter sp. NHP21005]|uniref:MFS transporter n=1 Tax=Helicobacter felistomachi TaxID=3040201 RepID=UPI0025733C84|nr:MFS transporter [Helicobacter sp. NHP21005]BEG56917.1 MFS transporter [Helicobacter sp. NHP21005]
MRHYLRVVFVLTLSNFCIAVSYFLISGILTSLSLYYGVSNDQVGNLVTVYTLGVAVGIPFVSTLFSRFNYRNQLVLTSTLFALSNVLMFFSHSLLSALIARFIGGLMHGGFDIVATIICFKAASKIKKHMALSLVVSGFLTGLAVGMPLAIWVSEHFGLLTPFLLIACVDFLAALLALFVVPRFFSKPASLKNLGAVFSFGPVWQGFLITAFSCASISAVFVYLRVLLEQHHFSPASITRIYLYYGVAGLLGHFFGVKLTNLKGSFAALSFLLIIQISVLITMSFSYNLPKVFLATHVIVYGFFSFASIVPFKTFCFQLARVFTPYTKNDTITLNEAAFFKGVSLGSMVGGLMVHHFDVHLNSICAALFALCALLILHLGIKKPVFIQNSKATPPIL